MTNYIDFNYQGQCLRQWWFVLACMTTAVLLSACGTLDNSTGAERFSLASRRPNDAVVIMSTGAKDGCMTHATSLTVFRKGFPYGSSSGAATIMMSVDFGGVKSDYQDHQGNLHVITLPAGDYYLAPVWTTMRAKRVHQAEFSVQAGEFVYLGEYFMTQNCSQSFHAEFRNEFSRDLQVLKGKNPELVKQAFQQRVLSFTGWALP